MRACLVRPLLLVALCASLVSTARAQDQAQIDSPPMEPEKGDLGSAPNDTAGEFTPAKGFDLVRTDYGSLNISFYGLARWLNQLPADQTFVDHLGRRREVKARNDINWHRTMLWFSGFALDPRLRYVLTVWSLPTTQQSLIFGNLQYSFIPQLTLGVGIGPTLTARSMQGSHPFWASSDRQMGEEFFRGGFASGAWVRGEILPRLHYWASVNTNLSQLGVTAANDSRDFAYSASLTWMPTTGEFGLRGGLADFEQHEQIATRFGASAARAREDRAAELGLFPNATQIRLSDGVLVFEEGALAPGVTVQRTTYSVLSVDAGLKYRGFTLQGEYWVRWLTDFAANGPLPLSEVVDHGFFVEAMYMAVPRILGLYATGTAVFDEFERFPWEVAGGVSVFPFRSRSWRLSLHLIYVDRSPTGSNFGFYTAGQTGPTISIGTDVLL